MEKQITLTAGENITNRVFNVDSRAAETVRRAANIIETPLLWLGRYYSAVLERPVNMQQTKALTAAQLAFFVTIMPMDYPVLLRIAACAWFLTNLLKCRQTV